MAVGLANRGLAVRRANGNAEGDGRRERKRALTPEASSRCAGAITRISNDQWELRWRNLREQQVRLPGHRRPFAVTRRTVPNVR